MEYTDRSDGCLYKWEMASEGKSSTVWGLRGKKETDCAGTYSPR